MARDCSSLLPNRPNSEPGVPEPTFTYENSPRTKYCFTCRVGVIVNYQASLLVP